MHNDAERAFRAAIHEALGFAPETIEPGKLHRFATRERGGDDAGWCRLFPDRRAGVFGCHRQGVRETWRASGCPQSRAEHAANARELLAGQADRAARQRYEWTRNAERIARLWSECVPIERGDPVARYLDHRGLGELWPLPDCLRLHPALAYWDGEKKLGTFPALAAPLISPDGRMLALHRTYLTEQGRKADVPTVKKLTATAGHLAAACIPLGKPAHGVIGIAEGIETALAARCASGVPTVAAYSASNLAAWQWPPSGSRLVIFADADDSGRAAANALQRRAKAKGVPCEVLLPTKEGTDWADVWAARASIHNNDGKDVI